MLSCFVQILMNQKGGWFTICQHPPDKKRKNVKNRLQKTKDGDRHEFSCSKRSIGIGPGGGTHT
jgi:hypothetical protein